MAGAGGGTGGKIGIAGDTKFAVAGKHKFVFALAQQLGVERIGSPVMSQLPFAFQFRRFSVNARLQIAAGHHQQPRLAGLGLGHWQNFFGPNLLA